MKPDAALVVLLATIFLSPLVAADTAQQSASELLGPVAASIFRGTPPEHRSPALVAANQDGAFLTVINLAGEAHAYEWKDAEWEAAQSMSEPFKAFVAAADAEHAEAQAALERLIITLAVMSEGVGVQQADHLLIAAHLIVDAQSALGRSASFISLAKVEGYRQGDFQRYVLTRDAHVALSNIAAAQAILDMPLPGPGDRLDKRAIDRAIAAAGGLPQSKLAYGDGGPLHRLALYAMGTGRALVEDKNFTDADLEAAATRVEKRASALRAEGFTGAWPGALSADARWWLSQETHEAGWNLLREEWMIRLAGAEAEATILEGPAQRDWVGLIVGGAIAAAVLGGSVLWRRTRLKRSRVVSGLVALGVAFTVLSALPTADALADPQNEPVPLTEADDVAGGGNLVMTSDGRSHFVWQERLESGKFVIKYRNYNPADGSWSPVTTAAEMDANLIQPRLTAVEDRLHLHWTARHGGESASPQVLNTCWLDAGACSTIPMAHSDPSSHRVSAHAQSAGGRLYLVWHDHSGSGDERRVYMRQHDGQTWGPRIVFDPRDQDEQDQRLDQTFPRVATDAAGRAHMVWDQPPPATQTGFNQAMYAVVAPGATQPSRIEELALSRGQDLMRIAILDSTVHVIYGIHQNDQQTYNNLHHRQRHVDSTSSWSHPVNVTRAEPNLVSWPDLTTHNGALVLIWAEANAQEGFFLSSAALRSGVWERPRHPMQDWEHDVLQPFIAAQGTTWNIVWTGSGPGMPANQLMYRQLDAAAEYEPPAIASVVPASGSWTKGQGVDMTAFFLADAPIDMQASQWTVDGSVVPFQSLSDRVMTTTTGLEDGVRNVRLLLVDENGGAAEKTWTLQVDNTPPILGVVWKQGEGLPTGWYRNVLAFDVTADGGGGAPARTQVQFGGNDWRDLTSQEVTLLEGGMFKVRFRAIDAAGNVQLGTPFEAGWDAQAPDIRMQAPPAWVKPAPQFEFNATAPSSSRPGAPIQVVANLTADGVVVHTSQVPASQAAVSFTDLAEGVYELTLEAFDAAGNRQAPLGPWTVGVDATPPTVSSSSDEEGILFRVQDAASGLQAIQAPWSVNPIGDDGDHEVTFRLPSGTTFRINVVDLAGNERTVDLDATGAIRDSLEVTNQVDEIPNEDTSGPMSLAIVALLGVALWVRRP